MSDTTDNLLDLIEEHTTVTIHRDVFDSRDLIEARKQAESEVDDEDAETEALQAIIDGVTVIEDEGVEDFPYGATFIADSYFEEYAQEFAEDIGAINKDATWPNTCIDWEKAARELQQDYTSVDIDGTDYWVR